MCKLFEKRLHCFRKSSCVSSKSSKSLMSDGVYHGVLIFYCVWKLLGNDFGVCSLLHEGVGQKQLFFSWLESYSNRTLVFSRHHFGIFLKRFRWGSLEAAHGQSIANICSPYGKWVLPLSDGLPGTLGGSFFSFWGNVLITCFLICSFYFLEIGTWLVGLTSHG